MVEKFKAKMTSQATPTTSTLVPPSKGGQDEWNIVSHKKESKP